VNSREKPIKTHESRLSRRLLPTLGYFVSENSSAERTGSPFRRDGLLIINYSEDNNDESDNSLWQLTCRLILIFVRELSYYLQFPLEIKGYTCHELFLSNRKTFS